MLRQVDVLWVVELGIGRVEDGVDHPGLQVQQHCPGDVVLIVRLSTGVQEGAHSAKACPVLLPPHSGSCLPSLLKPAALAPLPSGVSQGHCPSLQAPWPSRWEHLVEKDVLAVSALGGKFLHDALGADTMLGAQLFPELEPNWRGEEGGGERGYLGLGRFQLGAGGLSAWVQG